MKGETCMTQVETRQQQNYLRIAAADYAPIAAHMQAESAVGDRRRVRCKKRRARAPGLVDEIRRVTNGDSASGDERSTRGKWRWRWVARGGEIGSAARKAPGRRIGLAANRAGQGGGGFLKK